MILNDFVAAQHGFTNGPLSRCYGKFLALKASWGMLQECFAGVWFSADQRDVAQWHA